MVDAVQSYTVTSLAGELVAGMLHGGAGTTIRLTDAQARYELLLGSIVPAGTAIVVEQPAGPVSALDRLALTRGSKDWDASVGELLSFLLDRIIPQIVGTLGGVEGRILGGAAMADNTLAKLADRITALTAHIQSGNDGKASLISPAFGGIPTAPTASPTTATQQLATTAFVATAIAALSDSAPATLDTLRELAGALANDPNYAATIATALGRRLRFDAVQVLSAGQIATALSNLGVSTFAQSLFDDFDAVAMRATLGLGSAALLSAGAMATAAHGHAIGDISGLQAALDAKAALSSPAFGGVPTAPTAPLATATQQLATTAFVAAAIAALADSAPATLDTLRELAAALGNDPNYATTIATALGNRLRFDAAQTLSPTQLAQVRANLGQPTGPTTPYAPALSAAVGTIAAFGSCTGSYQLLAPKVCLVEMDLAISNNGDASQSLYASLPFGSAGKRWIGCAREMAVAGHQCGVQTVPGQSSVQITKFDNTYPGGSGARIVVTILYEVA